MHLVLKDVNLHPGDQLKVKGLILPEAERFQIDLGSDEENLALHFNPRYRDDTDGAVLVCNSKTSGIWGHEKREIYNPLERCTEVKIVFKLAEDVFEVELPDGHEVHFPNHMGMNVIRYIRVTGDFKLKSFKIC